MEIGEKQKANLKLPSQHKKTSRRYDEANVEHTVMIHELSGSKRF